MKIKELKNEIENEIEHLQIQINSLKNTIGGETFVHQDLGKDRHTILNLSHSKLLDMIIDYLGLQYKNNEESLIKK